MTNKPITTDQIPDAPARLIPPKKAGGVYTWRVLSCPHCGKKHNHGGGTDPEKVNELLGHRVAHCLGKTGLSYNLVRANT